MYIVALLIATLALAVSICFARRYYWLAGEVRSLGHPAETLRLAVAANEAEPKATGVSAMPLDTAPLEATVAKAKAAMEQATVVIAGFKARQQASIDAALANGATAAQLQPFVDHLKELDTTADALLNAEAADAA